MYSWEIYKFLEERQYYIGGDDLAKVTSVIENPQLNHIKFNPWDGTYDMWDKEGNYFHFQSMTYEEAKARNLVKEKVKVKTLR